MPSSGSRPRPRNVRGRGRSAGRPHRDPPSDREIETSAPDRVLIGTVRRAHGVSGDLSVSTFSERPDRLTRLRRVFLDGKSEKVRTARPGPGGSLILGLESVTDRDDAEALRGRSIEVEASALPPLDEGEYYHYQIVGAEVCDPEGNVWGTVTEILETGANDVFVVAPNDVPGPPVLVPAIKDVVLDVDVAHGRVTVDLPEGLR